MEELKRKSLLAAAVARSRIYFSGGARVQLQDERLSLGRKTEPRAE